MKFLLPFLLLSLFAAAQPCDTRTYLRTYDIGHAADGGQSIMALNDGNFIWAGYSGEYSTLAKINAEGAVIWQKQLDFAAEQNDRIQSIQIDDNTVVGWGIVLDKREGRGTGAVLPRSTFVFRYNHAEQKMMWTRTLSGAWLNGLTFDPKTGNYWLVGDSPQKDKAIMVLLDKKTGAVLKTQSLAAKDEAIKSADIAAWNKRFYTFQKVGKTLAVAEWTEEGTKIAAKKWNYSGGALLAKAILPDQDKMVLVAQETAADGANGAVILMKIDAKYKVEYCTKITINDPRKLRVCSAEADENGFFITATLSDDSGNDLLILHTDRYAKVNWAKAYKDEYFAQNPNRSLVLTPDFLFLTATAGAKNGDTDALWGRIKRADGSTQSACNFISDIATESSEAAISLDNQAFSIGKDNMPSNANPPKITVVRAVSSFACPDCHEAQDNSDGSNPFVITPGLPIEDPREGEIFRMGGFVFEADSTKFTPDAFGILDELFNFLKTHPNAYVEIGGHTNGLPGERYCQSLSTRRAQAVVDYLVEKGISNAKLQAKGYGKTQPIASNMTLGGRNLNQRVEMKVLKVDKPEKIETPTPIAPSQPTKLKPLKTPKPDKKDPKTPEKTPKKPEKQVANPPKPITKIDSTATKTPVIAKKTDKTTDKTPPKTPLKTKLPPRQPDRLVPRKGEPKR
jgi:outer membrane protein OmpA-like peptidoglycan-associated protein